MHIFNYTTTTINVLPINGGWRDPALQTNYSAWCLRECHNLSRLVSQLHTSGIGCAIGPHPTVRANTNPPQTGIDLHRPHPIHGTTNETNIKVGCNTYSGTNIEDGIRAIDCSSSLQYYPGYLLLWTSIWGDCDTNILVCDKDHYTAFKGRSEGQCRGASCAISYMGISYTITILHTWPDYWTPWPHDLRSSIIYKVNHNRSKAMEAS